MDRVNYIRRLLLQGKDGADCAKIITKIKFRSNKLAKLQQEVENGSLFEPDTVEIVQHALGHAQHAGEGSYRAGLRYWGTRY
ncbi:hypothetical protein JCM3770_003795 [Rhodotorula araucariae]